MSAHTTDERAVYACDGDDCDEVVAARDSDRATSLLHAAGWQVERHGWITLCPKHKIPAKVEREIARLRVDRALLENLVHHPDPATAATEREAIARLLEDRRAELLHVADQKPFALDLRIAADTLRQAVQVVRGRGGAA